MLENAETTGSYGSPSLPSSRAAQLDPLEIDASTASSSSAGSRVLEEPERGEGARAAAALATLLRDDDRRAAALPARGRPPSRC